MLKKNGFTLIELLVVLGIIGILAGMILFSYQGARKLARDGKRKADLEQIRSALEIYRTDCKTYPSALIKLTKDGGGCNAEDYMSEIPADPAVGQNYSYSGVTTNAYTLCAYLETSTEVVNGCASCGTKACNYKTKNP